MKHLIKKWLAHIVALLALITFSYATNAADLKRNPMVVINALADRIYVLGETSGKVEEMAAAEEKGEE